MGTASSVPPVMETMNIETAKALCGEDWDEDAEMRFKTLAVNKKWGRKPGDLFSKTKWVLKDHGTITKKQFCEQVLIRQWKPVAPEVEVKQIEAARSIQRAFKALLLRKQKNDVQVDKDFEKRARRMYERTRHRVPSVVDGLEQMPAEKDLLNLVAVGVMQGFFRRAAAKKKLRVMRRARATVLLQRKERGRQARNRVARLHAAALWKKEEEWLHEISKTTEAASSTRNDGPILSLPHPWCTFKQASAAQLYLQVPEIDEQKVSAKDRSPAGSKTDTKKRIDHYWGRDVQRPSPQDALVWLRGALVHILQGGSQGLTVYKKRARQLVSKVALWDLELIQPDEFVSLQMFCRQKLHATAQLFNHQVYIAQHLAEDLDYLGNKTMRDKRLERLIQSDLLPTPYMPISTSTAATIRMDNVNTMAHSGSVVATSTKSYNAVLLTYFAMAIDSDVQQFVKSAVKEGQHSEHYSPGIKPISTILHQVMAGANPFERSDMCRCTLVFDSANRLIAGFEQLMVAFKGRLARCSNRFQANYDAVNRNSAYRDIQLELKFAPENLLWGMVFERDNVQSLWEDFEAENSNLSWYSVLIRNFLNEKQTLESPVEIFIEVRLVLRQYLQHRLRCSLCGHIAEAKDDISLRERLRPQKKVPKEDSKDGEEDGEDEAENKAAEADPSNDAAPAATS